MLFLTLTNKQFDWINFDDYYANLCCLSREKQIEIYNNLLHQFSATTLPFSHLALHTLLINCLASVPEPQNILILSYETLTAEIASYIELFHSESNIELISVPYEFDQTDFLHALSSLLHTYHDGCKSFQIALLDIDMITAASCLDIFPELLDYDAHFILYSHLDAITDLSGKIFKKRMWKLEDMLIEEGCPKPCANFPSVIKIKELLSLIDKTDFSETENLSSLLSETTELENYIITNREKEHTYFYCHWLNEIKNALLNLYVSDSCSSVYLEDLKNAMNQLQSLLLKCDGLI